MLMSSDLAVIAEAIATLELPESLKVIEEEAFYGDTSIEKSSCLRVQWRYMARCLQIVR